MTSWTPRQTHALIVVAVLLIGATAFGYFVKQGHAAEEAFVIAGEPRIAQPPPAAPSPAPSSAPATEPAEVVVHVAGAVKRPGVYRLPPGTRAVDAIHAAGGPTTNANTDAINLAAKVEDGQQLYLPNRTEQAAGGAPASSVAVSSLARPPAVTPSRSAAKPSSHAGISKLKTPGEGTVNINTADATELQRLPGVGPAMAARILDYRQQVGRFGTPEQLMDVSGIGEKKLAKMQPFVRVR